MTAPLLYAETKGLPRPAGVHPPPRARVASLARRSTKATRRTKQHSLQTPHVFCGACRQEIELQEGIARPGHACTSPSHERPKHLHSATMCLAVHQPFEDGEDSFCGPACIVAFNAKMRAEHDESLAWLEVDEEPPEPPAPMPIRRREGEPDAETEEPQATADTVFESVLVKPRVAVGRQRRPVVSDR